MNRPKIIKIGYADYKIEWVQKECLRESQNAWATFDAAEQKIRVAVNCPAQRQASTLIHEIIHGIDHHFDLPTNDDPKDDPNKKNGRNESIITGIAEGLSCVIRDNPRVWEWITKCLKSKS